MRWSGILATVLTLAFASGLVACQLEVEDRSFQSSRATKKSKARADHDDDTSGEDDEDEGNPNADERPDAPTDLGTAASTFALTISNSTPAVDLGESITIDVNVVPQAGFTGAVAVSVSGLPQGATAAPVTVRPGNPGKLVISAAYGALPSAPGSSTPIVVSGTAGAKTATANANFKIAPRVTLRIPVNVEALAQAGTVYRSEWGAAFGAAQQALRTQQSNPIVVQVFNADSTSHVIHGNSGFAHGSTAEGEAIGPRAFEMQGGSVRTRTVKAGESTSGYPHDIKNGAGASFRIRVDEI